MNPCRRSLLLAGLFSITLCSGKDPLLTRQRDREADWAAVDLRIQEEQRAIAARMLNLQKKVEVLRQPLGRHGDPDAVRRPPSRDPPPTAALPEVEIAWDHSFDSSFDSLTAPSLRSETTAEKSGTSPPSTVERWSCRTALAESDRRRRMHLREAETACDERERAWTARTDAAHSAFEGRCAAAAHREKEALRECEQQREGDRDCEIKLTRLEAAIDRAQSEASEQDASHARVILQQQTEHSAAQVLLAAEHVTAIEICVAQRDAGITEAAAELETLRESAQAQETRHETALTDARNELRTALRSAQTVHAAECTAASAKALRQCHLDEVAAREEMAVSHAAALFEVQREHAVALAEREASVELSALARHDAVVAKLSEASEAVRYTLRAERAHHEETLAESRTRHSELDAAHAADLEVVQRAHAQCIAEGDKRVALHAGALSEAERNHAAALAEALRVAQEAHANTLADATANHSDMHAALAAEVEAARSAHTQCSTDSATHAEDLTWALGEVTVCEAAHESAISAARAEQRRALVRCNEDAEDAVVVLRRTMDTEHSVGIERLREAMRTLNTTHHIALTALVANETEVRAQRALDHAGELAVKDAELGVLRREILTLSHERSALIASHSNATAALAEESAGAIADAARVSAARRDDIASLRAELELSELARVSASQSAETSQKMLSIAVQERDEALGRVQVQGVELEGRAARLAASDAKHARLVEEMQEGEEERKQALTNAMDTQVTELAAQHTALEQAGTALAAAMEALRSCGGEEEEE